MVGLGVIPSRNFSRSSTGDSSRAKQEISRSGADAIVDQVAVQPSVGEMDVLEPFERRKVLDGIGPVEPQPIADGHRPIAAAELLDVRKSEIRMPKWFCCQRHR
jgi:hypothetical protein